MLSGFDPTAERILIIGDSMTHRDPDNGPVQLDISSDDSPTNPGDILATYLLANGAAAVRTDSKVGRSAYSFFHSEDGNSLMASDLADFQPTQVIVFLGTNDLGLGMVPDGQAMQAIHDTFAPTAQLWAIGPPTLVGSPAHPANDVSNAQSQAVVDMMTGIFGADRFIDARPLTADIVTYGRARDGVHFSGQGSIDFAQRLLSALQASSSLSFSNLFSYFTAPVIAGVSIVVMMAVLAWKHSKRNRNL